MAIEEEEKWRDSPDSLGTAIVALWLKGRRRDEEDSLTD